MIVSVPRWGLSPLESNTHAVDIDADHPYGVYVARCGHRLFDGHSAAQRPIRTPLHLLCPVDRPVSLLARDVPGKHRRTSHRSPPGGRRYVAMIDARTLTEHLLTDDAVAAGRRPTDRYVTLCGLVVLSAALTVGERDYCRLCAAVAR